MKKIIIAGLLVMSAPLAVQANSAGCGLGSTLFKGQSGIAPNVLAATTNGISGNQTFGITTGTLGCNQNDTVTAAVDGFVDSNMERVARDMSTGQGESLETLAALMGIESADKAAFFKLSQSNFTAIYSRDDVTSSEVVATLKAVMKSDATLAKYVA
ncbi:MAG: DUF3015 domain-containing protein [Gammaproteobacteria bacterium]|nr:DUF3015 domain-containing protein [Gammaproteobacteria bacterium]